MRVIRILVFRVSKTKSEFGIVAHAFKPSTRAEEATDVCKFKGSLVYTGSSKAAGVYRETLTS